MSLMRQRIQLGIGFTTILLILLNSGCNSSGDTTKKILQSAQQRKSASFIQISLKTVQTESSLKRFGPLIAI